MINSPTSLVDRYTSLHATIGTLAALHHRDKTGEGQLVEDRGIGSVGPEQAADPVVVGDQLAIYRRIVNHQNLQVLRLACHQHETLSGGSFPCPTP